MELWDIYDRDGNLTGLTKTRGDAFEPGEYHLGVSLWIVNHNREVFIQKRAATKRIHPNIWGITGGAVVSGETSMQGCIREAKEELGVSIGQEALTLLSRAIGRDMISDDYITLLNFPAGQAIPQPEEVSEVKWATFDEIERLFFEEMFMLDDLGEIEKIKDYIKNNIKS